MLNAVMQIQVIRLFSFLSDNKDATNMIDTKRL